MLLAWPLVFDGVLGETSPKANDIKNCFKMDDKFAGSRTGYYVDDMTLLSKIVRADTRMGGFQVCTNTETGNISSFRIKNANKYGNGNTISMSKLGTGSTTCGNYMLRDPVNEIVTNLVLFFNRTIHKPLWTLYFLRKNVHHTIHSTNVVQVFDVFIFSCPYIAI